MRWPSVPGELTGEGAEPAGRGAADSSSRAAAIGVRTRRPRRRSSGPAGCGTTVRSPLPSHPPRPQVPGPRSPVYDGRRARAASTGACRGKWGRPGTDAAGGVRRVEAALPVAVTALPGRVDLGLPHPHAHGHCCSFSRRLSGFARGFPRRSPRPTGGSKATAPPVVGCVGSGQCAASVPQVSANLDAFLPKTLASPLWVLPFSLPQTFSFVLFCSKQTRILYLFYAKGRPDFQCDKVANKPNFRELQIKKKL